MLDSTSLISDSIFVDEDSTWFICSKTEAITHFIKQVMGL
jgi:hypothetical protein